MVRAGAAERCDRRQARRRRWRGISAVLFGRSPAAAHGHGESRPRGSAVPFRFRGNEGPVPVSLPVAILAGGLATRLGPLTASIPKSLVDVAGRPFAEHQIELLRRYGLTDITFLVGHFGEMIRDAMGDGARWGVTLQYVFDGPRP